MGVMLAVGVRVGVLLGPPGVFVSVGVLVRDGVTLGVSGVLVAVGVLVATGVPPGSVPQTREPLTYAGMLVQSE